MEQAIIETSVREERRVVANYFKMEIITNLIEVFPGVSGKSDSIYLLDERRVVHE